MTVACRWATCASLGIALRLRRNEALRHRYRPELLGGRRQVVDLTPQNKLCYLSARDGCRRRSLSAFSGVGVIEPIDMDAYRQFLTEIGYLLPER